MKKQPEITEKTRQAFVDVFCELYCQTPIEKISIREIANRSGYNRSTFYQYFSDIYELLNYVENDVIRYMEGFLQSTKGVKLSSQDFVQNVILMFEHKGKYLHALLSDYGSIRFLDRLKAELPINQLERHVSEDHPLLPYVVEFHISTVLSLFRLWVRRDKDLSHEELFSLIDALLNTGVSSLAP